MVVVSQPCVIRLCISRLDMVIRVIKLVINKHKKSRIGDFYGANK